MQNITAAKGDYIVTTEKAKMDVAFIHHFLSTEAYWSKNIPQTPMSTATRNVMLTYRERIWVFSRFYLMYRCNILQA
jgi:hypothetical protein